MGFPASNLDLITVAIWLISFIIVIKQMIGQILSKKISRTHLNYYLVLYILFQIFIVFIYLVGGTSNITFDLFQYLYIPALFVVLILRVSAEHLSRRSSQDGVRANESVQRVNADEESQEFQQLIWDERFARNAFLASLAFTMILVGFHFSGILLWFFSLSGVYVDSAISFTVLLFVFWLIYAASLRSKRKGPN